MKQELANIICTMISNIGCTREEGRACNLSSMEVVAMKTAEGISQLEMLWPNLTHEEKQEIKAVVDAIKTSYSSIRREYNKR